MGSAGVTVVLSGVSGVSGAEFLRLMVSWGVISSGGVGRVVCRTRVGSGRLSVLGHGACRGPTLFLPLGNHWGSSLGSPVELAA